MITWNNYLLVALCPPTILILTSLPFKSWFDTIVYILLLPVSLNQLIFFSLFIHSVYLYYGISPIFSLYYRDLLSCRSLKRKAHFSILFFFLQRASHLLDAQ